MSEFGDPTPWTLGNQPQVTYWGGYQQYPYSLSREETLRSLAIKRAIDLAKVDGLWSWAQFERNAEEIYRMLDGGPGSKYCQAASEDGETVPKTNDAREAAPTSQPYDSDMAELSWYRYLLGLDDEPEVWPSTVLFDGGKREVVEAGRGELVLLMGDHSFNRFSLRATSRDYEVAEWSMQRPTGGSQNAAGGE